MIFAKRFRFVAVLIWTSLLLIGCTNDESNFSTIEKEGTTWNIEADLNVELMWNNTTPLQREANLNKVNLQLEDVSANNEHENESTAEPSIGRLEMTLDEQQINEADPYELIFDGAGTIYIHDDTYTFDFEFGKMYQISHEGDRFIIATEIRTGLADLTGEYNDLLIDLVWRAGSSKLHASVVMQSAQTQGLLIFGETIDLSSDKLQLSEPVPWEG